MWRGVVISRLTKCISHDWHSSHYARAASTYLEKPSLSNVKMYRKIGEIRRMEDAVHVVDDDVCDFDTQQLVTLLFHLAKMDRNIKLDGSRLRKIASQLDRASNETIDIPRLSVCLYSLRIYNEKDPGIPELLDALEKKVIACDFIRLYYSSFAVVWDR